MAGRAAASGRTGPSERPAQGRTAEVFDRGDGTILKLFRAGFPRGAVEREVRAAEALAGHPEVPCPRFLGSADHEGRPGLLYERIEGPSQLAALAARPFSMPAQARLAGVLHARVHAVKAPPPHMPARARALFGVVKRLYLRCYLAGYAEACGRDLSRLGELMVPLAAARLAEGGSPGERRRLLAFVRSRVRRRAHPLP